MSLRPIALACLVLFILILAGSAYAFLNQSMLLAGKARAPSAPQTIASISPTSGTVTQGSAGGTLIANMSVTMSPTTPTFSGSLALVSSNAACTGTNDTTNFQISGLALQLSSAGSSASTGSYHVCVQASQSGLTSLYQQVAVTISSSSGITPPAGATAANYTTLVANFDWTGQTQSSLKGSNITLGATSNWLDCAGASSPIWYEFNQNSSSQSAYPPCSDITVTNDSSIGQTVLEMTWSVADNSNGFINTTIATGNYFHNIQSLSAPQGAYFEVIARTDSQSVNAYSPQGGQELGDWWEWPQTNDTYIEFDFLETYANGDSGPDGINNASPPPNYGNPGFNNTVYHTYGFRITFDGTNYGECSYLDGTFVGCGSEWAPGSTNTSERYLPQLLVGHGGPPSADIHFFVQRVRIWSCSSWQTTQCTGTVLTGSP